MKTVKRIIAVVLCIVSVVLIGYLVFTGSRLSAVSDTENTATRSVYYVKTYEDI